MTSCGGKPTQQIRSQSPTVSSPPSPTLPLMARTGAGNRMFLGISCDIVWNSIYIVISYIYIHTHITSYNYNIIYIYVTWSKQGILYEVESCVQHCMGILVAIKPSLLDWWPCPKYGRLTLVLTWHIFSSHMSSDQNMELHEPPMYQPTEHCGTTEGFEPPYENGSDRIQGTTTFSRCLVF